MKWFWNNNITHIKYIYIDKTVYEITINVNEMYMQTL